MKYIRGLKWNGLIANMLISTAVIVTEFLQSKLICPSLQRDACVEDAKQAEGITAKNAEDIVSDNFLCSGGIEPTRDDIACKGMFDFGKIA